MALYKCLFCRVFALVLLQTTTAALKEDARTLIDVKNITAVAGKDKRLLLSCPYFKSIPVIWKKNGIAIYNSRNTRVSLGTLLVTTLSLAVEGEYECNFQDLDGNGYMAIFNVTINETPRILQRSKRHVFSNGSATVLNCKANGKPKPDVFWINEKGFSPISPPTVTLVGETSLKISSLNSSNSKVFICIAQNMHGRAKVMFKIPSVAKASVRRAEKKPEKKIKKRLTAPVFVSRPSRFFSVTLGRRVEINCDAKGEPKPKILITKLRPWKQQLQKNVIERVRITDAGFYECKAVNSVGTIRITFFLKVKAQEMKAQYKYNLRRLYNPHTRGYTNWSSWSRCSNPCGIGVKVRTRKCRVTQVLYKARFCTKLTTLRRMCFGRYCYGKS